MQRLFLILIVPLLGLLLSACSSTPMVQSLPQTKLIVVDGDASDWDRPLAYYDKETKLSFSISNDSTKLYFCIEAFDQELQTKIVRGGLQLWLDTTGGTGKDIGMLYPVPSTMQHVEPQRGGYESSSDDFDPIGALRRNFFRAQANELQLTGFLPPAAGLVPLKNAFGIEVRINWDTINNVLNYEAAIPFSTFYKRILSNADSTKIIGLTFTVNGVARSGGGKRQKEPDETAGGDGNYPGAGAGGGYTGGGMGGGYGAGGMGHGGGGRHGGGGGSGSASNPLADSETLSVKLRLAKVN